MVPTKAATEVTDTDPKPSMRKRQPGTPAFIRQTKDGRLGSLLSIYHKIPLVRNILLSFPDSARTYGHNSEWWKGQPILKPEVLAAMARGEQVSGDDGHPAFSEELHRLMAFLDNTDRSYATVDALTETTPLDQGPNTWSVDYEMKFLDHLIEGNASSPEFDVTPMANIGRQVATTTSYTMNESSDDSDPLEIEQGAASFALLDIGLSQDQWSWVNTLYDALDELLWTNAVTYQGFSEYSSSTAALVRPAEVITMRFNGNGVHRPCEIPGTFYADRYMETNQHLARHFQRQIFEIRRNVQRLDKWEKHRVQCKGEPGCSQFVWLNSQPHDIRECRQKIIEAFGILIDQQRKNAQWRYYDERWNKDIPYSMNDLRLISTWAGPYELTAEEEAKQKRWDLIIQTAKNELEQLEQDIAGESGAFYGNPVIY